MKKDDTTHTPRVLIVGAGGFTGSFLVREGVARGYEVYAGVRASTSRRYLEGSGAKYVVMDFEAERPVEALAETLRQALPEGERWDYIIYNLGATKCLRFTDFNTINYRYLQNFTDALKAADMVPEKMVYISSLSAVGPADEKGGTPYTETLIPTPNTRYGASKLKAEMWLATAGIPTVILRCTGVYGPHDRDYYLMFKSIAKGWDFSVGFRRQTLSFIYVEDMAHAAYDALLHAPAGETYHIAEGVSYTQREFRKMVAREMKKRVVVPVRLPLIALKAVSVVAEKIGVLRGTPSTLNSDKYNIMAQRNWGVDISKAHRDFGFSPRVSLQEGIRRTLQWYKEEKWL